MTRFTVFALLCLALAGCVVVPNDGHAYDHRYGYHGEYRQYDRDGYGYRDHGD